MEKKPLPFWHPASILSTCFWIGKIPFAPGTFGSLFAVLVVFEMMLIPRDSGLFSEDYLVPLILLLSAVFFVLGTWASGVYAEHLNKEDPGEIVIDEFVGQMLTLGLAATVYYFLLQADKQTFLNLLPLMPQYLLLLFILFRVFDIVKPWAVGWADRNVHGGLGIMLDDLVAAVFAVITFYAIFFLLLYTGGFVYIYDTFLSDFMQLVLPE